MATVRQSAANHASQISPYCANLACVPAQPVAGLVAVPREEPTLPGEIQPLSRPLSPTPTAVIDPGSPALPRSLPADSTYILPDGQMAYL
ncbi:uncharacterized protein N7484_005308 [Penicillium longicatenatum]|uniref:uncharacterized protein n=1 Tax=Penicillium longicatenatum TaxID=1561947 RepID=UPI00254725C5|nr:uncharacterized protein N7484_005308 [Penicillium longicatenatum]KAJ5651585.1 hypothetical protein N7484_005308 [Penicillium longicatenatum]